MKTFLTIIGAMTVLSLTGLPTLAAAALWSFLLPLLPLLNQ